MERRSNHSDDLTMANLEGGLVPIDPVANANRERINNKLAYFCLLANGAQASTILYKMQASDSGVPSGFVTWLNTTGDDGRKPAAVGVQGPSVVVAQWIIVASDDS